LAVGIFQPRASLKGREKKSEPLSALFVLQKFKFYEKEGDDVIVRGI
jgi:hypothetical protein